MANPNTYIIDLIDLDDPPPTSPSLASLPDSPDFSDPVLARVYASKADALLHMLEACVAKADEILDMIAASKTRAPAEEGATEPGSGSGADPKAEEASKTATPGPRRIVDLWPEQPKSTTTTAQEPGAAKLASSAGGEKQAGAAPEAREESSEAVEIKDKTFKQLVEDIQEGRMVWM